MINKNICEIADFVEHVLTLENDEYVKKFFTSLTLCPYFIQNIEMMKEKICDNMSQYLRCFPSSNLLYDRKIKNFDLDRCLSYFKYSNLDVNYVDKFGFGYLYYSLRLNNNSIYMFLISHQNINFNMIFENGNTPLLDVVSYLLEPNQIINDNNCSECILSFFSSLKRKFEQFELNDHFKIVNNDNKCIYDIVDKNIDVLYNFFKMFPYSFDAKYICDDKYFILKYFNKCRYICTDLNVTKLIINRLENINMKCNEGKTILYIFIEEYLSHKNDNILDLIEYTTSKHFSDICEQTFNDYSNNNILFKIVDNLCNFEPSSFVNIYNYDVKDDLLSDANNEYLKNFSKPTNLSTIKLFNFLCKSINFNIISHNNLTFLEYIVKKGATNLFNIFVKNKNIDLNVIDCKGRNILQYIANKIYKNKSNTNHFSHKSSDWFDGGKTLVNVAKPIGIEGKSIKGQSYDIRGAPNCPKYVVSPWLQSSIEPNVSYGTEIKDEKIEYKFDEFNNYLVFFNRLVLNSDININNQDIFGNTLLTFVNSFGDKHVLSKKIFERIDVDVNITNYKGYSSLLYASKLGNWKMFDLFYSYKHCKPNFEFCDSIVKESLDSEICSYIINKLENK